MDEIVWKRVLKDREDEFNTRFYFFIPYLQITIFLLNQRVAYILLSRCFFSA